MTTYNFYGDGDLYALSLENGSILWNQTVQRTDSTPVLAGGKVYLSGGCDGFSDLQTYCFDAANGELVWVTDVAERLGDWRCSWLMPEIWSSSAGRTMIVSSGLMPSMPPPASRSGAIRQVALLQWWRTGWSSPLAAAGYMPSAWQILISFLQTRWEATSLREKVLLCSSGAWH